jgi:glycosyltransferase involved in cell wall biosynthesis
MDVKVKINGAFRGQKVTGQQRYASEITRELLEQCPDNTYERVPGAWWQAKPWRAWAWSQSLGWSVTRRESLLTLTSRGPLLAKRHLVVVHDLFVLTNPEWFSRIYVASHAPILRLQLLTAKMIIAVSDPVAIQVRELVGTKKPILVVPNAPSSIFQAQHNPTAVAETCAAYGVKPGCFVLSVGSQDPRKNLDRLVAAFLSIEPEKRLECPLVLVGGASSIFGTVALSEDATILAPGYIPDVDLALLYAGSRVVVFIPLDEGFGLPAIEALRSGARLITSDIPVMNWVCGSHASYVDPCSDKQVAESIRKHMSLDLLTLRERTKRQNDIDARFSWFASAKVLANALGLSGRF